MAATATPESGTKDKNYDLITVTHLCLEHVWRLEQYAQDADRDGDKELGSLFRRMQDHSRPEPTSASGFSVSVCATTPEPGLLPEPTTPAR